MADRQFSGLVGLHERESRAGHVFLDTQRAQDGAGEHCFSGAQIALQRHGGAHAQACGNARAERFRVVLGRAASIRARKLGNLHPFEALVAREARLPGSGDFPLIPGGASDMLPPRDRGFSRTFMSERIVIIGAGQAGAQAVATLRAEGFAGSITMVGDEPFAPYQRPPLSKAYLSGALERERLFLKPDAFYAEAKCELILGVSAKSIDRAKQIGFAR